VRDGLLGCESEPQESVWEVGPVLLSGPKSPIEDKPLTSEPELRPPKDPEMQQGM